MTTPPATRYAAIYARLSAELLLRNRGLVELADHQRCTHARHTHTTRTGTPTVLKLRYLVCRRCGWRVKSEERQVGTEGDHGGSGHDL
jgi:hypothetical protein